jgi:ATP-dependent DNA helicase RecG
MTSYTDAEPEAMLGDLEYERILTVKRRARGRPFDVQPLPSAALADLDRVRFEHDYLPAAFAPDVLEANDRTLEQR